MKTGKCPKCHSADVRSNAGMKKRRSSQVNRLEIGGSFWPAMAAYDSYVCVNCGYMESYIADREKLKLIAERWPRAGLEMH